MLGKNHVAVRMTMPTLADMPKDTPKNFAEQPCDQCDREIDALLQICRDC